MFANPFLRICAKTYGWVICLGDNLQSLFLLLIRLIWGHQFVIAGYSKFLDLEKTAQFFASLGLPHPSFYAPLVATIELVCGSLLLIGFASRLAAIPLIITMIAAIGLAHNHVFSDFHFIFDPSLLVTQTPFPFLIAALIIFIFGPGKLSLDGWIKRLSRNWRQY